jgi:hypothetical protein
LATTRAARLRSALDEGAAPALLPQPLVMAPLAAPRRATAALASAAAAALALGAAAAPPSLPAQVRLAFSRDASAVVVHWASSNDTAAPPYVPVAQWGVSPGALTNAGVNCTSDQYVAWNISSPRLHFCTLAGLPAGQAEIFYTVGNGGADFSPVARFRTALAAGDATPFSFAVTGDMGIEFSQPTMSAVAAAAQSADLRYFSIHNGDLAYADNRQSLNNGSLADGVLNDFYDMLSTSYAASVPTLFGLVRLRERAARLFSLLRLTVTLPPTSPSFSLSLSLSG